MTTQRIHFIGTANFTQAARETEKMSRLVQKANQDMSKKLNVASANDGPQGRVSAYAGQEAQVNLLRKEMIGLTRSYGAFDTASMKVARNSDIIVDKIQKQKFGVRDLVRGYKDLEMVYTRQIALQKSSAVQFGRTAAGSAQMTLFTPELANDLEVLTNRVDRFRTKLGFTREVVKSVSTDMVNWGKNTQWAGRQLMAGMTYPLAIVGGAAAKMAYDVDKGLTQIVKVYDENEQGFKESAESIRSSAMATAKFLGSEYGQSIQETLDIQSQLASTGLTGTDLQERTKIVTKARLLGELEIQDAMNATINLQETYRMSATDLANAFNYMNTVENQTSLTMQDFVEGIPKVSGVLSTLGADIKDTGILLTAMKTAGIDAKEGGTAIKSMVFKEMAPSATAMKRFADLTGKSLQSVVDAGGGDVIETLRGIGGAMDHLSDQKKVAVIKEVFGIHQGSKVLGMVKHLTEMEGQMQRVANAANMTNEELAEIAEYEIGAIKDSNWNRIRRAVESVKVGMIEFGEAILVRAAPAIQKFGELLGGLADKFNGMGNFGQSLVLWGLALTAAAGPVIMIVGLLGNFIGNMAKFAAFLSGPLAKRMELFTTKQKMQNLETERAVKGSIAYSDALMLQGRVMDNVMSRQVGWIPKAIPDPSKLSSSEIAPGMSNRGKAGPKPSLDGVSSSGKKVAPSIPSNAVPAIKEIASESGKAATKWGMIAEHSQGLVMAAGAMGMMSTNSDSMLNKISVAAFTLATFAPLLKTAFTGALPHIKKMGVAIAANAAALKAQAMLHGMANPVIGGSITKFSGTAQKGMAGVTKSIAGAGAALAGMAGPIGVATIAVGGLFYYIDKKSREAREGQEALNNTYKSFADVLGITLKSQQQIELGGKNTTAQYEEAGKKVLAGNEKMKKGFEIFKKSIEDLDPDERRVKIQEFAINEGMRARIDGASDVAAAELARSVAIAIDSQFADSFKVDIKTQVFTALDSVQQKSIDGVRKALMEAVSSEDYDYRTPSGSWSEGFITENFTFSDEQLGRIEAAARASWDTVATLSEQEMQKAFQSMSSNVYSGTQDTFDQLSDQQKEIVSKFGVFDGATLAKFAQRNGPNALAEALTSEDAAMTDEQKAKYMSSLNAVSTTIVSYLVAATGKTREEIIKQHGNDLFDINVMLGLDKFERNGVQKYTASVAAIEGANRKYRQELMANEAAGRRLTAAQRLEIENRYRIENGLPKVTRATGDLTMGIKAQTSAIEENNRAKQRGRVGDSVTIGEAFGNGEDAAGKLTNELRSIYKSVVDDMVSYGSEVMEEAHSATLDSIERTGEEAMKTFDAEAESMQAKYDKLAKQNEARYERRSKQFEARWDRELESFDAGWDKRMERFSKNSERAERSVSKTWDTRIKKIQDAIDAEQRAEEIRQKIFEKEKARISHLADMANMSIDINMAINSGDLDEAAKLSNDAQAAIDTFNIDDAGEASQSSSDRKIAALEKKKTVEENRKDRALQALKERQDAERKNLEFQRDIEKKALESQKENQRQRLESQRESSRQALEQQRKASNDSLAARREESRKAIEYKKNEENRKFNLAKRALEDELDTLQEFTPTSRAELNSHIEKIKKAYDKYGRSLKIRGGEWSKVIESKLVKHTAKAEARMRTEVAWKKMGESIAGQMTSAFGMTLPEFMKWLGKPISKKGKAGSGKNFDNLNTTGRGGATVASRHSGGIIDGSMGSRTGYSGKYQSQSEVMINALKGESVLNRNATAMLGRSGVDALNRGNVVGTGSPHIGTDHRNEAGDGPGVTGMAGAIMLGFMKNAIERGLAQKGAEKVAQEAASMMGGPVTGQFDAFFRAIAQQESGGNYSAVNRHSGALGKYQIMPANVAPWGKQYLNRNITPSQFLSSPALQDDLARAVLGSYFKQWGARQAAAAWYAGPGNRHLHNNTRGQNGYPSIKNYVDSIIGKMNGLMASSLGGPIGSSGGAYPGMGFQRMFAIVKKRFPSRQYPSPGQLNQGGHAKTSYHYQGRAVDFGSAKDTVPLKTLFNFLYDNYGRQSKELIYGQMAHKNIKDGKHLNYGAGTNAAHWNHVHWAMKNGGVVPGAGFGDKTRILGEPGEFMVRKKAVDNIGIDALRLLNSDRFINMPSPALTASGVSGPVAPSVDKSYRPQYNIEIDARGVENPDAIGDAVRKVIRDIDKKNGYNRRIGNDS